MLFDRTEGFRAEAAGFARFGFVPLRSFGKKAFAGEAGFGQARECVQQTGVLRWVVLDGFAKRLVVESGEDVRDLKRGDLLGGPKDFVVLLFLDQAEEKSDFGV